MTNIIFCNFCIDYIKRLLQSMSHLHVFQKTLRPTWNFERCMLAIVGVINCFKLNFLHLNYSDAAHCNVKQSKANLSFC